MLECRFEKPFAAFSVELLPAGPQNIGTYTGNYAVTPSFERQELETQGKVMRDNVVAEEIPVAIVSNTAGGNTVIIGG